MRTGRPRSFDRDTALERAIAVFWEHGYDATSISLLTAALGIGAPSLYAAFGDKRALFTEALDRYMRTYAAFTSQALAEESRARDAVERLLRQAAVAYTRPDRPHGCLLISAATNCSPQSADIAAHLRDLRAAGTRALQDKITAAVRAGELPASTDPHALAAFYAATLQGMSAQARDGATQTDLEQIADTALRAWPTAAVPAASDSSLPAVAEVGPADWPDRAEPPLLPLPGTPCRPRANMDESFGSGGTQIAQEIGVGRGGEAEAGEDEHDGGCAGELSAVAVISLFPRSELSRRRALPGCGFG